LATEEGCKSPFGGGGVFATGGDPFREGTKVGAGTQKIEERGPPLERGQGGRGETCSAKVGGDNFSMRVRERGREGDWLR